MLPTHPLDRLAGVTVWSAWDSKQYAGAFTVRDSALSEFAPGMDVEFARYDGPDVFIFHVESGARVVLPAAAIDLEEVGPGAWRLLHDGRMFLEVGPVPSDFRQRDFRPPKSYRLLTKLIRRGRLWPQPEWVTLPHLIRRG
jgi:hypothetical protein